MIHINKLRVHCIIGVFAHERENAQDVFLDVTLTGDWSESFESDSINDTLDYEVLSQELSCQLKEGQYKLLEKAAYDLAQHCLTRQGVQGVQLKIIKPHAVNAADHTAFEILLP